MTSWRALSILLVILVGWPSIAPAPEIRERSAFDDPVKRAQLEKSLIEAARGPKNYYYLTPPATASGGESFEAQEKSLSVWYRENPIHSTKSFETAYLGSPKSAVRGRGFANKAMAFFPALFSSAADEHASSWEVTGYENVKMGQTTFRRPKLKLVPLLKLRLDGPLAIVNGLPKQAEEYSKVFGGSGPVHSDMTAMRKASQAVSQSGKDFGSDFKAALESPSTVVVFVGHNDAGQMRLRSGESVALTKLSEQCERARKACLFVVCSGRHWLNNPLSSYSHPISPAFAAHVVGRMKSVLDENGLGGSAKNPLKTFQRLTDSFGPGAILEYRFRIIENVVIIVTIALVSRCDHDCPETALTARIS